MLTPPAPRLRTRRLPPLRPVELARGAWGVLLLSRPQLLLDPDRGWRRADSRAVAVARLLGARQLAQAALSGLRPHPAVLRFGFWVDVLHSISAVAFAVSDRSRARLALADAGVAATWAAVGRHDLARPRRHAGLP